MPFHIYGFEHAKAAEGAHGGQSAKVKYTAGDVRFTTSKDKKSLYVFLLGKPKAGTKISLGKMNNIGYGPASPVKRIVELKSGK